MMSKPFNTEPNFVPDIDFEFGSISGFFCGMRSSNSSSSPFLAR